MEMHRLRVILDQTEADMSVDKKRKKNSTVSLGHRVSPTQALYHDGGSVTKPVSFCISNPPSAAALSPPTNNSVNNIDEDDNNSLLASHMFAGMY